MKKKITSITMLNVEIIILVDKKLYQCKSPERSQDKYYKEGNLADNEVGRLMGTVVFRDHDNQPCSGTPNV